MGLLGALLQQSVTVDENNEVKPLFDYRTMIPKEEGYKADYYTDATGNETIGYGHKVSDKKRFKALVKELGLKLPLSEPDAKKLLNHDITRREQSLKDKYPDLTDTARSTLFDYYFNTGANSRGFKSMLGYAQDEDYVGMENYLRTEAIPYYKKKKLGGVARRRKKVADFIQNNLTQGAPSMLGGQ